MLRRFSRLVAPLALALLMAGMASAATDQERLARLKELQQRILMSEPAEKAEKLERVREWRKKALKLKAQGKRAGQRGKPMTRPTDADFQIRRGAWPAPGLGLSNAAAPPNRMMNNRAGEPDGSCQSEVSLAALGSHVVATWNDGIGVYGAPFPLDTQGFGYSADGGATWTDGGPLPNDGNFIWSSDPVVVVNEKTGAFYFCALVDDPGAARNGIAVVRGSFCGNTFTWGRPVVAVSFPNTTNLLDKQWVAVDSTSGNLYLSFSNFTKAGGAFVSNSIQFIRSLDDGQTWSAPITLSAAGDAGLVQGSRPAVGPDGELYVVWHAIGQSSGPDANSPFGRDFLRFRKSLNQGQSFTAQITADSLFSNFPSGAPGFNRGIGITFPGIAVDRSGGASRGRVYLTWNESLNFYNDPFPEPGLDPAQSEIEPNNGGCPFPTSCPGPNATEFTPGEILRGLIATTGNPGDHDYWRWNATQGQTVIFYLDSLTATLDPAFRIFCKSGKLLAFSQNGSGGAALLVFTAPATDTFYIRVASYAGQSTGRYRILTTVNFPQNDRARDHRDIFVKSSADGIAWGPTVRVNDSPGYFDDWLPEVQVDRDGQVYVADYDWRDSSPCGNGSNVYYYRSTDAGTSWSPGTRVTDVTTDWTTTYSTLLPNQGDYIGLFAGDSTVHVAWGDGRNGDPDVFMATVTPATTCGSSPVCLVDTTVALSRITVEWSAPAAFTARLLRRVGTGATVDLGQVTAGGGGQILYQDNDVTPGQVHVYALEAAGYCEQRAGEVAVTPLCDQAPVTVIGSIATADSVVVTWGAPQGLQATLFRQRGGGSLFMDLGTVTANSLDQIIYVDTDVSPGQSYTYRLGVTGFCQSFAGTVTVLIPGGVFGIESIRPNPTHGDVTVWFTIDPTAPATLELLDITGRQVAKVPISCSSNPCQANLTQGTLFKSGLYFVRLAQGGHESVKRVSIFP